MAWTIEWSKAADRDLEALGHQERQRIVAFMEHRIGAMTDPRDVGEKLTGPKLGHLWKYRVGDYRILTSIEDKILKILVVKVGNRREIYR